MRKVNTKDIAEETWSSPKGKFGGVSREISVALGRQPQSTDLKERHPFDVEICRFPPGKIHSPYHSHSAQPRRCQLPVAVGRLVVAGTAVTPQLFDLRTGANG